MRKYCIAQSLGIWRSLTFYADVRADLGIRVSITPARFWREQVCLVRLAFPILGIWRRLTFYRDVRPDLGVSSIHLEPLFESRFSVRLDRINRALRLANTAIDAFVRVDDEHVLTLIEAVHRTYLDTVHVLTFDTAFIDDVEASFQSSPR